MVKRVSVAAILLVLAFASRLTAAAGGQTGTRGVQLQNGVWVVVNAEELATNPVNPGLSVVGPNVVLPGLNIQPSGGNDVVAVMPGALPAAYGASPDGLTNGCSNAAFADVGSGTYDNNSRRHEYTFVFDPAISSFAVVVYDWGDFMPYGACPNGQCAMVMTAYSGTSVVGTTEASFTSSSSAIVRLPTAGDACAATPG